MMKLRADYYEMAPKAMRGMDILSTYLGHCAVEASLRYLIEVRVSQINGCAYCCDMHSEQARAGGERQQRLDVLAAWRHAPFFSERERAALEWAESVTLVSETGVPDELYERTRQHFSEEELVDLTLVVTTMNAWNRLAVSFRSVTEERAEPAV